MDKKTFIIEATYSIYFKKNGEGVNGFYFTDVHAVNYSSKCTEKMVHNFQEYRIVKNCKLTVSNPFRSVIVNEIKRRYPYITNENITDYAIDWCFTHINVIPYERCINTQVVKDAISKLK